MENINRKGSCFRLLSLLTIFVLGQYSVRAQANEYCSSIPLKTGFEYIRYVSFADIENESENDMYSSYGEGFKTTFYKTGEYPLTIVNNSHYSGDKIACWIDWNKDGVFDNVKESVSIDYNQEVENSIMNIAQGTIQVPVDAVTGLSRMRIVLANGEISSCGSFNYGEVEDYLIDIRDITSVPNIDISYITDEILLGYPVLFNDLSDNYPTKWKWSFSPNTVSFVGGTDDASQNPLVSFDKPGVYSVSLTVENKIGSSVKSFESIITAIPFKAPIDLKAETIHNMVDLSWAVPLNEGFENYLDYSINFEPWTQYDIDNSPTGGIGGVDYSNKGYIGSFMVFNPYTTNPALSFFAPHSGNKMAICFSAQEQANDDWLISPKVNVENEDALIFFACAISEAYTEEFQVAVSTTGTNPEDFELLTTETESLNSVTWTPFIYDMSKYQGKHVHIAIHCISSAAFGLAIDDIMLLNSSLLMDEKEKTNNISFPASQKVVVSENERYTSRLNTENAQKNLGGYKIYRDGSLINTLNNPWSKSYCDKPVSDGVHEYYLLSTYTAPASESVSSDTVKVNVDNTTPYLVVVIDDEEIASNEKFNVTGITATGESRNVEIILENQASLQDLSIANIRIEGDGFKILSDIPENIKAGENISLNIEFSPTQDKAYNANVIVNSNDEDKPEFNIVLQFNKKAQWTYMIYLYEDKTGLDGLRDFNELEVNGSIPDTVNYIILYDANDDNNDGIFFVNKDEEGFNRKLVSTKISDFTGKDLDMNNWKTLNDFMLWTLEKYPAENYALNVWDHGSGIFKSNQETLLTKGCVGEMKLWEIDKALQAFTSKAGQKIGVLGFDVCLLGQLETVYQVKDYVEYVVACEKNSPGDGWDYLNTFKHLNVNPTMDARTLAEYAVNEYVESYVSGWQYQGDEGVTISATDCNVINGDFIPALNDLSDELIYFIIDYKTNIKTAINGSWTASSNTDHKDLGGFLINLKNDMTLPGTLRMKAETLYNIYKKAISAEGHTSRLNETATGLKIWLSFQARSTMDWIKYTDRENYLRIGETRWDDFLAAMEDIYKETQFIPMPPIELTGEIQDDGNHISWNKPDLSNDRPSLDEDFEDPANLKWTIGYSTSIDGSDMGSFEQNNTWTLVSVETFGDVANPQQYINSGEYALYIPYSAADFNWLITPEIYIKEGHELNFWVWYKNNELSSSDNQRYYTKFHVVIMYEGGNETILSWNQNTCETNLYEHSVSVDLHKYVNKMVKIAFVYEYSDGFQLALDDVKVGLPSDNKNLHAKEDSDPASLDDLKGYNIYRDGVFLNEIVGSENNSFVDNCSEDPAHSYYVTALYYGYNEESAASNEIYLDVASGFENGGINNTDWLIGPNPTNGWLNVWGEQKVAEMQLYSLSGNLVKMWKGEDRRLNLSNLPDGVYMLKITGVDNSIMLSKIFLSK